MISSSCVSSRCEVSVTFNSVTLLESNWKIIELNLKIISSDLRNTKFVLISTTEELNIKKQMYISKSLFASLTVSKGFHIHIHNCVLNGTTRFAVTLINIIRCNLTLNNVTFFNHIKYDKAPVAINSLESQINMEFVNFTQNYATYGIIKASNHSHVFVENSVFENNGIYMLTSGVFILQYNSLLSISHCKFTNNKASKGSCVQAFHKITLIVKNSTFLSCSAFMGVTIFYQDSYSNIETQSVEYIHRNAERKTPGNDETKVILLASSFRDNTGIVGGALYFEGSFISININSCIFDTNGGYKTAGAIFVQGKSQKTAKMGIYYCNFINNYSYYSAILYIIGTVVEIDNSTFSWNSCTTMSVLNNSIVTMRNSIFKHAASVLSIIDIQNSVILDINESSLQSICLPFGFDGFFIFVRKRSSVNIRKSYFGNVHECVSYMGLFAIDSLSNFTMTDSIMENSQGNTLRALVESNNSSAIFNNCTFLKSDGFSVSHNSRLQISNSTITGTQDTVQSGAFIEIFDNSHLNLTNCRILDNALTTKKLILVQLNSSFTFSHGLYARNRVSTHIAIFDGRLNITNITFVNNTVLENKYNSVALLMANNTIALINISYFHSIVVYCQSGSLMKFFRSNILLTKSDAVHNTMKKCNHIKSNAFIDVDSSEKTSLVDSNFSYNRIESLFFSNVYFVLNIRSSIRHTKSYLRIDNCTFQNSDQALLTVSTTSDIVIRDSFFTFEEGSTIFSNPYFQLYGVDTLRLWNTTFKDIGNGLMLLFQYEFTHPERTELLTLGSNFTQQGSTLQSNSYDFLQKAESMNRSIIATSYFFKLYHEETKYAASEYAQFNPCRTEDFSIFLGIKLIFLAHLLNKSRKIQYVWHGFFNGMWVTNIDLTFGTTSNTDLG